MTTTKFNIEKFTEDNDFNLWRIKMRTLLVHRRLEHALRWFDKLPSSLFENEMKDLMSKVQDTIILSYGR